MKNKLSNMSLEELIEIDNENTILSLPKFLVLKKTKLILLSNMYHFIKSPKIPNTLINDYEKYRMKSPIYKIIIELYNSLLDDLVLEIKNSSIDKDPLSIAILLGEFIIPGGYTSYTQKFHITNSKKLFETDNNYEIKAYELTGSFVIAGYGCCRHVNSFISDVLNKFEIKSDKIATISNFDDQDITNTPKINHLITGYIENKHYHLIDSYNHNYSLQENNGILITPQNYQIIPDFNFSSTIFKKLHWEPGIELHTLPETEINKKREKINQLLINGELEKFEQFKQNHLDIIEKMTYLVPLEYNRTEEKENQKILKYYQ